jgi:hypothetical protein
MALWGSKDLVGKAGSVTINLSTKAITGTGTTFSTSGFEVAAGDVIVVGAGATYGHAVIASVTSNTVASVATTQYLIPNPATGLIPAGTSYFITERPISSLENSVYRAPEAKSVGAGVSTAHFTGIFGVDNTEQGVAGVTTVGGKASAYKPAHAGWVGVTTYVDCHGNFRVKTETLVAMGRDSAGSGGITSDADDDTRYPDA